MRCNWVAKRGATRHFTPRAGFIFISAIQKWRPDRNELADFLDINIIL